MLCCYSIFAENFIVEKYIIIIIFVVFLQSQSNTTAAELLRLLDELALSFANNTVYTIFELLNLSEFI